MSEQTPGAVVDPVDDFVSSSSDAPPQSQTPAAQPPAQTAKTDVDDGKPAEVAETEPDPTSEAGKALAARKRSLEGRKGSIVREIHELTWQREQTKRELDAEKARLDAVKATKPETEPPRTFTGKPKPSEDDIGTVYQSYGEYIEALTDWKTDEKIAQREHAQQAQKSASDGAEVVSTFVQRREAYAKEHPEFETDMAEASDLPTNHMMDQHFMRSEQGSALMHYFAKHPDECQRVAGLAPGPTLVALGEIQALLKAAPSGPAPKPVPLTAAKPPIKPVGSSAVSMDDGPPGDDASLDEHAAYWDKKDREARR